MSAATSFALPVRSLTHRPVLATTHPPVLAVLDQLWVSVCNAPDAVRAMPVFHRIVYMLMRPHVSALKVHHKLERRLRKLAKLRHVQDPAAQRFVPLMFVDAVMLSCVVGEYELAVQDAKVALKKARQAQSEPRTIRLLLEAQAFALQQWAINPQPCDLYHGQFAEAAELYLELQQKAQAAHGDSVIFDGEPRAFQARYALALAECLLGHLHRSVRVISIDERARQLARVLHYIETAEKLRLSRSAERVRLTKARRGWQAAVQQAGRWSSN